MDASPTSGTVGLVLGKFAPLHLGHQYLIECARKQVERLHVLVYEDEGLSRAPLRKRADWIRYLYPDVNVIEGHDSPTCTGMDATTKRTQDLYIASVMPERITHVFASEKYVEHVAAGLGAQPVMVDQERSAFHISATQIRDNPLKWHGYMHPFVRRDLVRKVVLLGAESTGKTTLAVALAQARDGVFVPEYGREYWLMHHDARGRLGAEDMVAIAAAHRMAEDRACEQATRLCVCDTNALTTRWFCRYYGNPVLPRLERFASDCRDRYSLTLVCATDIPFVQDGTRGDPSIRAQAHDEIVSDLKVRGIPYHLVSGSVQERIAQVTTLLHSTP